MENVAITWEADDIETNATEKVVLEFNDNEEIDDTEMFCLFCYKLEIDTFCSEYTEKLSNLP